MKPIKTPKGLSRYIPGDYNGTLKSLRGKHPDLKLYLSATKKSDGAKFKAGQWAKLKNGEEIYIIAFDRYKYPLPIDKKDKPLFVDNKNGFVTTFYKAKYRWMTRAIHHYCGSEFMFTDINEYKGMKL